MLAAFGSAYPIGIFGQRNTLLWGEVCLFVSMMGVVVAGIFNAGVLVIILMIIFIISFQFSLGPIAFMHAQETCTDVAVGVVN